MASIEGDQEGRLTEAPLRKLAGHFLWMPTMTRLLYSKVDGGVPRWNGSLLFGIAVSDGAAVELLIVD